MSGPVQQPLKVKESDNSVVVRPCVDISFNAADFTVAKTGNQATISIDSTGAGASLTSTYVGYGDGSNLLTGSSKFTYSAASELLTLTCSDNTDTLVIKSTDTDANVGPIFTLFRDDGSTPSADDVLGRVMFKADNSVTATTTYAEITGICNSPTDGSEHGWMNLGVMTNGTVDTDYITLRGDAAQVCVNEGGADIDFRIEGQGEANLFRTNAVTKNIGIGAAPSSDVERVHITGSGADATTVRIESTEALGDAGPILELYRNATGADDKDLGGILFAGNDDGDTKHTFAEIRTYLRDTGAGGEDSVVIFYGTQFGSDRTEFIRYGLDTGEAQREVVINNGSSSAIDFRVVTDNNANMLRTSGANDVLGVGGSPTADKGALQVFGSNGGSGKTIFRVTDDGTDNQPGPIVELVRFPSDGVSTSGDDIGEIKFRGLHWDGTSPNTDPANFSEVTYADMYAEIAHYQGDGRIYHRIRQNGSLVEYFKVDGNTQDIIFNEGSEADFDFRVEGSTNANLLVVDGSAEMVAVGAYPDSGVATFQVPSGTMSSYCNVKAVRSDAVATQLFVNEDCQGQMWVNNSSTAWTLQLPEGGLKGQWFQFLSTDGDMSVDPQGTDTLNGGTATLTRSTNNEIYTVICIVNGAWILSNPA